MASRSIQSLNLRNSGPPIFMWNSIDAESGCIATTVMRVPSSSKKNLYEISCGSLASTNSTSSSTAALTRCSWPWRTADVSTYRMGSDMSISHGSHSAFDADRLEKRIAEHSIDLRRAVQVGDAPVEVSLDRETSRDRSIANTLHHRGECPSREPLHQFGFAGVHVHHARRDTHCAEARLVEQWIKRSSDQGIAAGAMLQVHQALDGTTRNVAVGVEVGRPVVAFYHRDAAARLQHAFERLQSRHRLGKMLQDEAHEDVIEGGGRKGQI